MTKVIARGGLFDFPATKPIKEVKKRMEWIIIAGSIIIAAYFIYSAIQRRNDLNEKQLEQGLTEENNQYVKSNIVDALEWDIIRSKADLEDAQKSGKKEEIKKANDVLQYRKAIYTNVLSQSVATHLKSNKHDKK